MRVVLQRVRCAGAYRDDQPVAEIGTGLVVFVGFAHDDTPEVVARMAAKVANLRVFEAAESKFGLSVLDAEGEVLLVSQFTLCADLSRGRRPNFSLAATTESARELYLLFASQLDGEGIARVVAGPFGSRLVVDVRNWGPFTVVLEGG